MSKEKTEGKDLDFDIEVKNNSILNTSNEELIKLYNHIREQFCFKCMTIANDFEEIIIEATKRKTINKSQ
jgi:hypothetical protein